MRRDYRFGGASKSRNETKRNEKEATHTNLLLLPPKRTRIFSCPVWLALSLDSVREVRLMLFSVYSLLWQLPLLLLTVLECLSSQQLHADSWHLQ